MMRIVPALCIVVVLGLLLVAARTYLFTGKIVAKAIDAPMELGNAVASFKVNMGRWPQDYAELRSSAFGLALTNYSHVDFTQNADGTLGINAIGPGLTNQITVDAGTGNQK